MDKIFLVFCLCIYSFGFSQDKTSIEKYGPVYDIENPDYKVSLNQEFKAVFDIADKSDSKDKPNRMFHTLARYIQLHSKKDLESNSAKAAMVIHGSAIYDLLSDKEYAKHHQQKGLKNPNLELLNILSKHNVDIIVCGQTSKHRDINKNMMHPKVKIALSAMTALIELQNNNYRLINF